MGQIQPVQDIEEWFKKPDPWGYEQHPDDAKRRAILKSLLEGRDYGRVLDIGCGDGFITRVLPGKEIIGVDISKNAVSQARANSAGLSHIRYEACSLFDLPLPGFEDSFDLIVVTGVLYPQYIGEGDLMAFTLLDLMLKSGGVMVSCHIDAWYNFRFPYITFHREYYRYREYTHLLEAFFK